MERDDLEPDPRVFVSVRRVAAVALVVAAVFLVLFDAFSDDFRVDSVVLGILLSGALLFADIKTPLSR